MADADLGGLIIRTVVSLVVVLSVIAVAFVIARRRATGAVGRSTAPTRARRGSRRRNAPAAIDVLGRIGLSRATAAVALRFGDRVILVAAGDQTAPTVLAEMDADEWDELQTVREPIDGAAIDAGGPVPARSRRPSFLEALRDATARHE